MCTIFKQNAQLLLFLPKLAQIHILGLKPASLGHHVCKFCGKVDNFALQVCIGWRLIELDEDG